MSENQNEQEIPEGLSVQEILQMQMNQTSQIMESMVSKLNGCLEDLQKKIDEISSRVEVLEKSNKGKINHQ